MKKPYLHLVCLLFAATSFAQVKDCYPNCTINFDDIELERIPSITSVEAIGTKCKDDIDKKLAQFRNEDEKNYQFLKNKYCAALSGWEQTGDCEHGGPPPCCTAPAGSVPWASVGTARAKAALMAEWHKVQNNREIEIENNLKNCLQGIRDDGVSKFNGLYSQATDCLKGIQNDKIIATYNKGLIINYVTQLNTLNQQMQALANKEKPDPVSVANQVNAMASLQTEICNKQYSLEHPVKATPGIVGGVRAEVSKPKVESQAITNSDVAERNNITQQKQQEQQQANNYVNAANTTDNGIQKSTDLSLAKINAIAAGNKQQAAQIQQQQNVQVRQSIQSLGNDLQDYVNQRAAQQQAESEAKERREQEEAQKKQDEKIADEKQRIKNEELDRQFDIDTKKILADYHKGKDQIPIEKIPTANIQVFYIVYKRDYVNKSVTLTSYLLNKYADGTWMQDTEIEKKINFGNNRDDDSYTQLLGAFTTKADAVKAINQLKVNAMSVNHRITISDNFEAINAAAKTIATGKNFWDN